MKREEMKAHERFRAAAKGQPYDRLPMLEWATWWDLTTGNWAKERPEIAHMGQCELHRYFGLDCNLQYWFPIRTNRTPLPESHGAPVITDMKEYLSIRNTLYPEPHLNREFLERAKKFHEDGDGVVWFTLEGFFWFPRSILGIENHLYSFYDEPELYHTICRDLSEWQKKTVAYCAEQQIMSVTESAIQIVFNINLKLWSGDNEYYTAALTIMLSAVQMVCMPLNGLGNGVQPIVSYNYGTGDSARIRKTVKITAVIALCGSVSVWLLSLLAPQVYGYMFNASPEVMALLRRYTPFFMMGTVMFFAQMTLQNVFIALNQAKISIFLACLRKVILLIPLCFLLPYAFGVSGVFYSEGIADLIAGIITAAIFFGMLPRILKKREGVVRQENSVSVGEAR